jgi:hypothetical protein
VRERDRVEAPAKAVLACVVLLGACASEEWRKENGEAATQQVISECTQQAMARASAEALASGTYVGVPGGTGARTGRTELPRDQAPPSNTGIQEQTFFNLCMREKGYELVPAAREAAR